MANDVDIRVGVSGTNDLKALNVEVLKLKANAAITANQQKRLEDSLSSMAPAVNSINRSFRNYNNYLQQSGKSAKRFQLGVQQAGYQVGDFAVQVASGTNWVTAFTQQGTQLVSFFGGPWGAAIGAAGAIVGAFAVYMMKSKEASDKTAQSLKTLDDEIKNIDKSLQSWLNTKKAASAGLTLEEMFGSEKLSDAQKKAEELRKRLDGIRQFWVETDASVAKYATDTSEYTAALEELRKAEERVSNLRLKSYEETLKKSQEVVAEKQKELQLEVLSARLGPETLAYRQASYELERDTYLQKLASEGIYANEIAKIKEAMDQTEQLKNATSDANSFLETGKNLWSNITGRIKAATAEAYAYAGAVAAGANLRTLPDERGGQRAQVRSAAEANTARILESQGRNADGTFKKVNSGGGGGKSPSEQLADNIKKLQEQLSLQEQLNGKTDAQRQIIQALGSDWNKVDASILKGLEDKINAQDALNKKIEEQQNIANTLQSSMENSFMSIIDGTSSVKDAFKSLASDILKELYRVLVVQRMVGTWSQASGTGSGIVGAVMGAFQAKGGVWQGGHQVQAFANGGVVGGPTMFPMAGGKTGLMGEAGPEAIMPLKRGKDGKLGVATSGDSGAVNIVQNFSFAANGDESVKKIIAQAAPQIAKMTQQQIIDSRRRGGAMKATFG